MRKYTIYFALAALLGLVSCSSKFDDACQATGSDNIILSVDSAPGTRAEVASEGVEADIDHIDVLIFPESGGSCVAHEHFSNLTSLKGSIVLEAKRSSFTARASYHVYLIANSTYASDDFENITLDALRSKVQDDPTIHITGLGLDGSPSLFLMDGMAHKEGSMVTSVVLNDGVLSNNTELKVDLQRAAAKIVITVKHGDRVSFYDLDENGSPDENGSLLPSSGNWAIKNLPHTTTLLAEIENNPTDLGSPTAINKLSATADEVVIKTYAYSHDWADESAFEKQTSIVANIPICYREKSTDEDGNDGDWTKCTDNYYRIPVSQDKVLKRNHCYAVTVTLNAPGAKSPSEPVEIEELQYKVIAWDPFEKIINLGDNTDRPTYLIVNQNSLDMQYIDTDETSLSFVSSSDVTVKINSVYYYDKLNQKTLLSDTEINNANINVISDAGLSGNIKIYSDIPTNNAIRYIEIEVTNNDNSDSQKITIAQYPLEYIRNVQGYYSYRSDFGGTTYEERGTNGYVIAVGSTYNSSTNTWTYKNNSGNDRSDSFFRSKVATQKNDGTSTIQYYYWNGSSRDYYSSTSANNAKMYYVKITATSSEYKLGKPRITNGRTDSGADNAELVSPSFMIASQLGSVTRRADENSADYLSHTFTEGINMAASHCEYYVETYIDKDGNIIHLNDWRLPTTAEIKIIANFQGKEGSAIDNVLGGEYYYSASEIVKVNKDEDGSGGTYLRCIRDAYISDGKTPTDDYWENE